MKLYIVIADSGGAWEPDSVCSVWDSLEKAQAEIQALEAAGINLGQSSSSKYAVKEIVLNTRYQQPIN